MLVAELRELLRKYNDEDLRLIIVEIYKSMPKKLREDKGIDEMLQDIHAYMSIAKAKRRQNKPINLSDLKHEIEQFIDYAYKQYYFAPNNVIRKKERPKWRFKVKSYIKDLQRVSGDSADQKVATELLQKLYSMLCYACAYYIFNTDNPFKSVGIEQTVLFEEIIIRKFWNGINNESIKSAIELVINSEGNREILHSFLIQILVANLKTPDSKLIAIDQCKLMKKELDKTKPTKSKKLWSFDSSEFKRIEKVNSLVEMIFRLNMELCEYDAAIKYFKRHNIEHDDEITLYVLLSLLLEYNQKDLWLREYNEALKRGIEPRKTLQKTYKFIHENNKLPEYLLY